MYYLQGRIFQQIYIKITINITILSTRISYHWLKKQIAHDIIRNFFQDELMKNVDFNIRVFKIIFQNECGLKISARSP